MKKQQKNLGQLFVPICLEIMFYMLAGVVDTLMLSTVGDQAVGAVGTANTYIGMAVALRYVPMRDDAEDVVQDSFIKVFSGISKFEYRGEGALQAWLLRIVTNEAVNFVRQQKRFTIVDEVPDDIEDEEPEVERVPPAELTRMIGELPDGYRLVLNMFVFEQKSHKEIAQLLGIKESSSASQYLRAKKLLGKKVKDYLSQADCSDIKELNHINEKSNE